MLKLLTKVYLPTKGEILINGINLNEYTTFSLREKMIMLFQEFFTYEETVRENIVLSEDNVSAKALYKAIPFESLIKRIKGMPQKLNTVLGTWFGDGVSVSKGQKQMLALTRIFYKKSDCYILDEPNSALDPRSEKALFNYINKNFKEKICILTLHVFTNIDIADQILMFDQGKIVAKGTHAKLYEKNKKYRDFYNLQERSLEENA